MSFEIKRVAYAWDDFEHTLGYVLPEIFKDYYERFGAVAIDNHLYFVGTDDIQLTVGLKKHIENVRYVYNELESDLDDDEKLLFYDGDSGWLPVGYTSNGDFIFCSNNSVLVVDNGFNEQDLYVGDVTDFINAYLNDDIKYNIISNEKVGHVHEIQFLGKRSIYNESDYM